MTAIYINISDSQNNDIERKMHIMEDHIQSDFIYTNLKQGLSHVNAFKTVTHAYTYNMEIQIKQ